jgi:lipopolysaccharide transport system ATP-binding protein
MPTLPPAFMQPVISIEHISKVYRLGQIGTGTFANDLKLWWARLRGRPDPFAKIGAPGRDIPQGGEIWALRDISFTVEQGEVLGIIGRNGAGKSTLLKILSRVTAPTSGVVKVKGRIASLLEVGTGFHQELTGRENIYLNGAILGMTRREIDRKFDAIVDFSGVEKFIDTPVKRYSSGMYVRLAFAVAAHLDPEILVVDEVLAVGDAEFQRKCLGKMGEVARDGRTVLFVSHNLAAIQNLCRHSMLIEQGRNKIKGPSDEVIAEYLKSAEPLAAGNLEFTGDEREGNGKIRFSKWSVVDGTLGDGYQIVCDHPCDFRIQYQGGEEIKYAKVSIALVIKDLFGQPILTGATYFKNSDFSGVPVKGSFTCHFPHMPLIPGVYKLHLWCSVDGEVADYIREAGTFTVLADDVYKTGKVPQEKHGFILVDHEWRVV